MSFVTTKGVTYEVHLKNGIGEVIASFKRKDAKWFYVISYGSHTAVSYGKQTLTELITALQELEGTME